MRRTIARLCVLTVFTSLFFALTAPVQADQNYLKVIKPKEVTVPSGQTLNIDEEAGSLVTDADNRARELLADAGITSGSLEQDPPVKDSVELRAHFRTEEKTYRVFGQVVFHGDFTPSPDMITETREAELFLVSAAQNEMDTVDQRKDDLMSDAAASSDPTLSDRIATASDAVTACLDTNANVLWPALCDSQFDEYEAAITAIAAAAPASTEEGTEAAPSAEEEPGSSPEEGSATSSSPSVSDDCTEGDILCLPVNLLIGLDDPNRTGYLSRLHKEGFSVLFNSLTSGFATVAGTFAFAGVLYGAFLYVTARGDEEQLTKAKQFIVLTIIGLVILSLAFVIMTGIRDLLYVQP